MIDEVSFLLGFFGWIVVYLLFVFSLVRSLYILLNPTPMPEKKPEEEVYHD